MKKNKKELNYNCTISRFAYQLNVPLWKAMEFGKFFKKYFEKWSSEEINEKKKN